MAFTDAEMARVQDEFISLSVTEQETIGTIGDFRRETGYLLDPHTAVGVHAALACTAKGETPVCLATAHPAKFGEAVQKATGIAPTLSRSPDGDRKAADPLRGPGCGRRGDQGVYRRKGPLNRVDRLQTEKY